MVRLLVTNRDGDVHAIEARTDLTMMEAIRDAGVSHMRALCGGCMACATCHVYIESTDAGLLPPASMAERRMLARSSYRRPTSRLACQIEMEDAAGALAVTIAPYE